MKLKHNETRILFLLVQHFPDLFVIQKGLCIFVFSSLVHRRNYITLLCHNEERPFEICFPADMIVLSSIANSIYRTISQFHGMNMILFFVSKLWLILSFHGRTESFHQVFLLIFSGRSFILNSYSQDTKSGFVSSRQRFKRVRNTTCTIFPSLIFLSFTV